MKGEVAYYFAFDVAYELQMAPARKLMLDQGYLSDADPPTSWPRGITLPETIAFAIANHSHSIGGVPLRFEIRCYGFGAINVAMYAPFEVASVHDLIPYVDQQLGDGQRPVLLAKQLCEQVCNALTPALIRPSAVGEPEAYSVFVVTDLGDCKDAEAWVAGLRNEIAGLLTSVAPDQISANQVEEVFRHSRSLTRSDTIVLAWDAAFAVQLAGPTADLLLTIELANLQIEEFRHMDRTIDRFLENAYADMETRGLSILGPSAVLRKLRRFRMDLAQLSDQISNTTKVFGDWHLARVYLSARERFHLDRWRESVEQRLGHLDHLYNLVRSEVWDRRMFLLELIIVVLFVVELMSSFGLFR